MAEALRVRDQGVVSAEIRERLVGSVEAAFAENGWGALDPRVRAALLHVERHKHVPGRFVDLAYQNVVVPLDPEESADRFLGVLSERDVDYQSLADEERDRLISLLEPAVVSTATTPSVVALMTQAVLPGLENSPRHKRALDVGAGLGYQAALLHKVGFGQVFGVEIRKHLAHEAQEILDKEGYSGARVFCADGKFGLPYYAPYDAIVVAAAVLDKDVVRTLTGQLTEGGKLVLPEGRLTGKTLEVRVQDQTFLRREIDQRLFLYERTSGGVRASSLFSLPQGFVDLL